MKNQINTDLMDKKNISYLENGESMMINDNNWVVLNFDPFKFFM